MHTKIVISGTAYPFQLTSRNQRHPQERIDIARTHWIVIREIVCNSLNTYSVQSICVSAFLHGEECYIYIFYGVNNASLLISLWFRLLILSLVVAIHFYQVGHHLWINKWTDWFKILVLSSHCHKTIFPGTRSPYLIKGLPIMVRWYYMETVSMLYCFYDFPATRIDIKADHHIAKLSICSTSQMIFIH